MADYDAVEEVVLGGKSSSAANTTTGSKGTAKEIDIKPILNNLANPIRSIHDPDSHLLKIIEKALREGYIVIFDISQMDSKSALLISSLIVKYIFEKNKENFIETGGESLIKATFVLEEAHTILSGTDSATLSFINLAKEGRKYNLGGIFITQQPGSIPIEIISQGDNFFIFHLLSKNDLKSLSNANAHYSDDIITQILNEPIRGKCYMWTSHQPFVIPIDVQNFEDVNYSKPKESIAIQEKNNILAPIFTEITNELQNPQFRSIFDKFLKLEKDNHSKTIDERTVLLFRNLTEEEKKYLDAQHGVQRNKADQPFAVTYKFYQALLLDKGIQGDTE
jgi:hypothetical protein